MVFEQLFRVKWIKKKEGAFFIALLYSFIGLISAWLIFPANIGISSVAFISILMIPSLNKLLSLEENIEIREKKFSLMLLFKDHKDVFKVYAFLFFGVFITFALIALIFDNRTILDNFKPQLTTTGMAGNASANAGFLSLIYNNLLVFIVSFILSIAYGAGAIFFITWNASVWGVVFGFFARQSASFMNQNPFLHFINFILPFLPHTVTESLAYISAAIVGGVVSKAVLREKIFSKKFNHIITDSLLLFVLGLTLVIIAAFIEVNVN